MDRKVRFFFLLLVISFIPFIFLFCRKPSEKTDMQDVQSMEDEGDLIQDDDGDGGDDGGVDSITVLTPNGGVSYTVNETMTIEWEFTGSDYYIVVSSNLGNDYISDASDNNFTITSDDNE
jgi:hypothetical protein